MSQVRTRAAKMRDPTVHRIFELGLGLYAIENADRRARELSAKPPTQLTSDNLDAFFRTLHGYR